MSNAWKPTPLCGAAYAVTATTAAFTLPPGRGSSVRFSNKGTNDVFLDFGDGTTPVAVLPATSGTLGGMFIAAGSSVMVEVPAGATKFAAITNTSTATLYAQRGEGDSAA